MSKENPFKEFLDRYGDDPVRFVKEMLGLTPDPWQAQVMMDVAKGVRKISIRSGHGVGKSAVLSWLAVWFLLTRYRAKIVMTAPSAPQLFDALFAETRTWVANLPDFLKTLLVVTSDRIALKSAPDEVFLSARTSRADSPEAMQGVHSDFVLLLGDEASGIAEEVFNAASGSMSGHNCTTILTGNPTRTTGFFYDTHNRLKESWKTYHVSSFDSPRVSKEFIQEVLERSGEDSNEYRIRVLGEFPTTDDNTIISREIVESAMYRDVVFDPQADEIWGLDVARYGDDRTVLIKRTANVVTDVQFWRNLDLMQTCGAVKAQFDASSKKPSTICVDSIGLGAGVVDRLREQGLPVLGVNVSETPVMGNYRNLRAELWFRLKDWLDKRACKLPKNDTLASELCSVRYLFTSSGKAQVESKEEMKRRGLKSPDFADALVLTFAAPEAQMLNPGYKWQKPLRRSLSGIVCGFLMFLNGRVLIHLFMGTRF